MTSTKPTGGGGLSWHLLQPHPSAALEVGGGLQAFPKIKAKSQGICQWLDGFLPRGMLHLPHPKIRLTRPKILPRYFPDKPALTWTGHLLFNP